MDFLAFCNGNKKDCKICENNVEIAKQQAILRTGLLLYIVQKNTVIPRILCKVHCKCDQGQDTESFL